MSTKETIRLIETARKLSDSEWDKLKEELLKGEKISKEIYNLFKEMGVPSNMKGYEYLKDAIIISLENPELRKKLVDVIYPTIGKKYGASWRNVEKDIRTVIETTFKKGNKNKLEEIFQATQYSAKENPSNSKFLAGVVEYIKNS